MAKETFLLPNQPCKPNVPITFAQKQETKTSLHQSEDVKIADERRPCVRDTPACFLLHSAPGSSEEDSLFGDVSCLHVLSSAGDWSVCGTSSPTFLLSSGHLLETSSRIVPGSLQSLKELRLARRTTPGPPSSQSCWRAGWILLEQD